MTIRDSGIFNTPDNTTILQEAFQLESDVQRVSALGITVKNKYAVQSAQCFVIALPHSFPTGRR